jgi:ribosomal protein S18 acetylase RimI-like enzyme
MEIRPIAISDFDRLTKTFVRAYSDDWSEDVARRYLVKFFHFEPESCLAAMQDGKLVGGILGYSYLKQDHLVMFIQELFVDPDYRKSGCGTELVKALRRSFSASQAVEVTPMVKGDTRVLNFYNSLGFETPTSIAFIVDPDDDDDE